MKHKTTHPRFFPPYDFSSCTSGHVQELLHTWWNHLLCTLFPFSLPSCSEKNLGHTPTFFRLDYLTDGQGFLDRITVPVSVNMDLCPYKFISWACALNWSRKSWFTKLLSLKGVFQVEFLDFFTTHEIYGQVQSSKLYLKTLWKFNKCQNYFSTVLDFVFLLPSLSFFFGSCIKFELLFLFWCLTNFSIALCDA